MASGDPPNTSRKRSAAAAKPSGKKAKPLSQKEQSARFKETARELEADESGKLFESALTVVIPTRTKEKQGKNG